MLTLLLTIARMFSRKVRKLYIGLLSSYMSEKYKNWYFCEVAVEGKNVIFSFANTKCSYHVAACHNPTSFCFVARGHIGNHILMLNGLKKPDEIPVIRLVSRLSFIKTIGVIGWLSFKKQWKGISTVNITPGVDPMIVVRYI